MISQTWQMDYDFSRVDLSHNPRHVPFHVTFVQPVADERHLSCLELQLLESPVLFLLALKPTSLAVVVALARLES